MDIKSYLSNSFVNLYWNIVSLVPHPFFRINLFPRKERTFESKYEHCLILTNLAG